MSALELVLLAKRNGASFVYRGGRVVAEHLDLLPAELRSRIEMRMGDVLACVEESSVPDVCASDAVDAARSIARNARRSGVGG